MDGNGWASVAPNLPLSSNLVPFLENCQMHLFAQNKSTSVSADFLSITNFTALYILHSLLKVFYFMIIVSLSLLYILTRKILKTVFKIFLFKTLDLYVIGLVSDVNKTFNKQNIWILPVF